MTNDQFSPKKIWNFIEYIFKNITNNKIEPIPITAFFNSPYGMFKHKFWLVIAFGLGIKIEKILKVTLYKEQKWDMEWINFLRLARSN